MLSRRRYYIVVAVLPLLLWSLLPVAVVVGEDVTWYVAERYLTWLFKIACPAGKGCSL